MGSFRKGCIQMHAATVRHNRSMKPAEDCLGRQMPQLAIIWKVCVHHPSRPPAIIGKVSEPWSGLHSVARFYVIDSMTAPAGRRYAVHSTPDMDHTKFEIRVMNHVHALSPQQKKLISKARMLRQLLQVEGRTVCESFAFCVASSIPIDMSDSITSVFIEQGTLWTLWTPWTPWAFAHHAVGLLTGEGTRRSHSPREFLWLPGD